MKKFKESRKKWVLKDSDSRFGTKGAAFCTLLRFSSFSETEEMEGAWKTVIEEKIIVAHVAGGMTTGGVEQVVYDMPPICVKADTVGFISATMSRIPR